MDHSDEEAVRKAIEQDRQSLKKARETWQQASGKEVSESTFRAFLSALAALGTEIHINLAHGT